MYSQQNSGNPTRIQNDSVVLSDLSIIPNKKKSSINSKMIRSLFTVIAAVSLLLCVIVTANHAENSLDVGFTADFQNNKTEYFTYNHMFGQYNLTNSVTIRIHGQNEISVNTPPVSVGEILNKLSITLGENDVLNCQTTDIAHNGFDIKIDSVTTETRSETQTLPFATETVEVQTVPKGSVKVLQAGVNGSSTKTYKDTYRNGELVSTEVVEEAATIAPTNEIIQKGVGGTYTDCNGNSYNYSYYIDVTATAYGTLSGRTATGKQVALGMIAVDPRVIPLGTQVYLTGSYGDMGVCSAEDTGGSIVGNKIDVFLGDDATVLANFGIRSMRVYILG